MSHVQSIESLENLRGKRVLVREDLNVPLNDDLIITDSSRITAALPTLQYLMEKGARVILTAHLGRPKGQVKPEFSLEPVYHQLIGLLGESQTKWCASQDFSDIQNAVDTLQDGELLLLENIRFYPGEEKNDDALAKQLGELADIYVNDAFGTSHRAHASTEGITKHVDTAVAGLLMNKEIEALSSVLKTPQMPFTAIIGGSKVSTKLTVLESLLGKVDCLVIGGAMIFTFLKSQGVNVGGSMVEDDLLDMARKLLANAKDKGVKVLLASDVVIADAFSADANIKTVDVNGIEDGWMGLDVGPQTIEEIQEQLTQSRTVLWNGPLGVFEMKPFETGTRAVADTLVKLTADGQCKTILGGGDTVAAIEQFGISKDSFTHVSTGGGASLEFIEGKTLPGIAALEAKAISAV